MKGRFDVLAIGNAIVDIIASVEDDILLRESLQKGSMTLVDEARSDALSLLVDEVASVSGGSAANSAVGVSSLGGRAAFIGKVKADRDGRAFAQDIRGAGVYFETSPAHDGPSTARCLVLVTPDGERTMTTYLGACQNLGLADIDKSLVESSSVLYLEGYLWDPPEAKSAFLRAAKIAHDAGNRVALSLSDPFCVDRYRDEFRSLVNERHVDVLFANEHEIKSLYQTGDIQTAVKSAAAENILIVITQSERGCTVVEAGKITAHPSFPVKDLVDTTGAGDLFAAGFLRGLTLGGDSDLCARIAVLAAAEAIQHFGARPQSNLLQLAKQNGLLSG